MERGNVLTRRGRRKKNREKKLISMERFGEVGGGDGD